MTIRYGGVAVVGGLALAGGMLLAMGPDGPVTRAGAEQGQVALRQRGAYLWSIANCMECHSPRDAAGHFIPTMLMAGHPAKAPLPAWDDSMLTENVGWVAGPTGTAFAGPWGVSVAPNLTPDKETGIGAMTPEQMIRSFRDGKHWKENRPILRPMPVQNYAGMSDEDVRAIHAFLMSLPAVRNAAPASVPAEASKTPAVPAK